MDETEEAPAGPADYVEDLNRAFHRFEQDSGWTISTEAREIIRHSLVSVMHDFYGPGHASEAARRKAVDRVVSAIPEYFRRLQDIAPSRSPRRQDLTVPDATIAFDAEPASPDTFTGAKGFLAGAAGSTTIGGVAVMQNTELLASMAGCLCWPR
jgi:hypothetical protein